MNPKNQLDERHISPKKSLGQNFLHDPNTLEKIVAAAELTPQDVVLEIGVGTALLTERLAQTARQVIAIEIDERLQPVIEQNLAPFNNVQVVYQDILQTDVAALMVGQPYTVVANVPYYITSAILRHLLESQSRPRRLVLTMQLEVAERLVAQPPDMSILSVSVQYYAQPQIVMRLNRAVFWPRPDVDSAVVRLDTYEQPPVAVPDDNTFFRVVRAGFSQKRKQLKNALASGLHISAEATTALLETAAIDPRRRAETLTLPEWGALTRAYATQKSG